MLTFVESPAFTKQCTDLWSDAEYSAFQHLLAARPEVGDLIPGLGGLRKVRWSAKGRGKRGGARVIYLLLLQPGLIYLFLGL
jgi:mRNA-degrading endonuclease RelE of RelBE toxin-antitoxin system